jgi:hypothetical protein
VFHSTNSDSLLKFVEHLPDVEVVETDAQVRIARRDTLP